MFRWIGLSAVLGLAGCTYYYYPGTAVSPYAMPPAGNSAGAPPANANCRTFTQQVTIEGKQTQATGLVCQQPDGSWKLM